MQISKRMQEMTRPGTSDATVDWQFSIETYIIELDKVNRLSQVSGLIIS